MNAQQQVMDNQTTIEQTPYVNTASLQIRLDWFRLRFDRCGEVVFHNFEVKNSGQGMLMYMEGLFDLVSIEQSFLEPMLEKTFYTTEDLSNYLFNNQQVPLSQLQSIDDGEHAIEAVLNGHGVCFIEGDERLLVLPFTKYEQRAINEAPNEPVLRGPREAFVESIQTNVSLLRRRVKSSSFKTESLTFGKHTQTKVVLAYLEGVCQQTLIDEMKLRLSFIDIDAVLDSAYLEEVIADHPSSPFTQVQYTERPDTVSASILEGRIAVMVDNTPNVLLAPVTFFMKMQSAEDYYQNYIAATWIRNIRYVFLIISVLLPSFYIAVTTFHPEMIPFSLLMSVSASREIVPFPALLEALVMELAFEGLREASVRIPKAIGQTVSIIGALIIGTAAVQAGIVSASMVIIVSVTGIASFIIPSYDLSLTFRLLRFPMMLLAGMFGIFGIACGVILIYIHMVNLESFGVPYLSPITPLNKKSLKDIFIRAPWWRMTNRSAITAPDNERRSLEGMRAWVQVKEEKQDET